MATKDKAAPQAQPSSAVAVTDEHEETLRKNALKEREKNLKEQIAQAEEHDNPGLIKILTSHLDDLKKELK